MKAVSISSIRSTIWLSICRRKVTTLAALTILLIYYMASVVHVDYNDVLIQFRGLNKSSNITNLDSRGQHLSICPALPPNLEYKDNILVNISEEDANRLIGREVHDGRWSPAICQPRWRIAVIVPYRDRKHQIGPFLHRIHTMLQRQQLDYTIIFVEQSGNELFNRAKLLNVGYVEATSLRKFDCFIFHDVDMLPEDDRHLYHCSAQPRHLVVACSNNNYKSAHSRSLRHYFGGACLMNKEHLIRVNGWSNKYWGWGGEDDDMMNRLAYERLPVWRYPAHIARYTMVTHKPPGRNLDSHGDVKRNMGKYKTDGLSTLQYNIVKISYKPLYIHVLVDIGKK